MEGGGGGRESYQMLLGWITPVKEDSKEVSSANFHLL